MNIPSIEEQKEIGLKLLESANHYMAEYCSDEDAILEYKRQLRVGICFGADHSLSLIKTAIKRHHNPEKWLSANTIHHTVERSCIRYFKSLSEKEIYLTGIEDTRRMHEVIEPEVINFLEAYVSNH